MSSEVARAGINKVVLRTAAYYAALGVGTYRPPGHAHFDRLEVFVQEPFTMSEAQTLSHSGFLLRVEFWQGETRLRYVDFFSALAGFSGLPLISSVK